MRARAPTPLDVPPLPPELDEVCDRFEAEWRGALSGGCRPRLEDFVAGAFELHRAALLLELLAVEILFRRHCGETPTLEEYQQRFPWLPPHWLATLDATAACENATLAAPNRQGALEGTAAGRDSQTPADFGSPAAVPLGRWGNYELLEEIGRGGMGVVYRARQLSLNRVVALKMILAGTHAGTEESVRFFQEAEFVAQLRHPNIVQVYEFGIHLGQPFFSMEFVEGGSLEGRLHGQPQPFGQAASLIETLAEAIHTAHAQGIIHRDLKPANILLTADGTPKITDFGLAKHNSSGLTVTGAVMGTPSYMAPEQAQGMPHSTGPAADTYALGAVLYEMLTGRPPFKAGSSWATVEMVLSSEPVPCRQLNAQVPRDLETIVLKCLRKEPGQRYATALELAEDLARFGAGQPIRARPVGPVERLFKWGRRNPQIALLTTSVAFLLFVLTLVSIMTAASWRTQRDHARATELQRRTERDHARSAEERAVAAERQRRQELYHAYLHEARSSRLSGRVGQREKGLAALRNILAALPLNERTASQQLELRDEAVACLSLADAREIWRRPCRSYYSGMLDIDPDLENLVQEGDGASTVVTRTSDGSTLSQFPALPNHRIRIRAFDDCGQWVADLRDSGRGPYEPGVLCVRNRQARGLDWDIPVPSTTGEIVFHVDGRRLFLVADAVVHVYDLVSGKEERHSPARFRDGSVAAASDGKWVAIATIHQPSGDRRPDDMEDGRPSPRCRPNDGSGLGADRTDRLAG